MNLYIWREYMTDYSDGLALAAANTLEEAKQIVRDNEGFDPDLDLGFGENLEVIPDVKLPEGFVVTCLGGA